MQILVQILKIIQAFHIQQNSDDISLIYYIFNFKGKRITTIEHLGAKSCLLQHFILLANSTLQLFIKPYESWEAADIIKLRLSPTKLALKSKIFFVLLLMVLCLCSLHVINEKKEQIHIQGQVLDRRLKQSPWMCTCPISIPGDGGFPQSLGQRNKL